MTVRNDQISSVLRRAVQGVISRGLNDPRIRGLISVTEISVAPDLADATVYVSIHPAGQASLALRGLTSASKHIRVQAAKSVSLRRMPRLHFKLDDSIKRQNDLEQSLRAAGDADAAYPPEDAEL